MNTIVGPKPATDKQIAFIGSLIADRDVSGVDTSFKSSKDASALIDTLMKLPKKSTSTPAVAEGFYVFEGDIYRVVKSKSSSNLYAKVMTIPADGGKGSWTYVPGGIKNLVSAEKLSADIAADMGRETGICMICGAFLTAEESVTAGIGPICAGRI